MEENKLFALVWKLAALVLCTLIVSISGYFAFETYSLTHATDPVAARCAVGGDDGKLACLVLSGRR